MNNHMLLTAEAVAQWLPLPTQNIDDSRSRVRSFLDVFPYATLWTSEFHEMLLVGSMEPIELDTAKISQRFQQDTVRSTLQDVGIGSATALLSTWVTAFRRRRPARDRRSAAYCRPCWTCV